MATQKNIDFFRRLAADGFPSKWIGETGAPPTPENMPRCHPASTSHPSTRHPGKCSLNCFLQCFERMSSCFQAVHRVSVTRLSCLAISKVVIQNLRQGNVSSVKSSSPQHALSSGRSQLHCTSPTCLSGQPSSPPAHHFSPVPQSAQTRCAR